MKIAGTELTSEKVFIIAEVGSNHEGCIKKAKQHIDQASDIGADAVKFQSLNSKKLYIHPDEDIRKLHELIDMDEQWHKELASYSKEKGILFSSSPTYLDSVSILKDVGVDFIKIASAQIGTYPKLIREVAKLKKPTIFSTGIATYNEITDAVRILKEENNNEFAILHCNSQYPTPPENVYLKQIEVYKKMYNCVVGFSDHTEGIDIVMAAVALGAQIIEKHFKVDDNCRSPDASISINTKRFSELINGVKKVKQACITNPRIFLEDNEAVFKEKIRYKMVLKHEKREGDLFKESDFIYLRTKHGIDVSDEKIVIDNMKANKVLHSRHVLEWSDLVGNNR